MLYPSQQRRLIGRSLVYVVGFLLFIGLASLQAWHGSAMAQGSDAGVAVGGTTPGTIPGTVPPPLRAQVTILHAAPFATPLAATAIDICDQADAVVDGLAGILFQQVAQVVLDPGTYDWHVATTGSNCGGVILVLPTLKLANASHTLVAITGDGVNYPVESVVTALDAGGANLYLPLTAK
ncbi:MAG: hypothetical protein WAU00_20600 [Caldilinea sp.]